MKHWVKYDVIETSKVRASVFNVRCLIPRPLKDLIVMLRAY